MSPTALLVTAVYLGSDRPRLIASLYLAGAFVMSLVMGIVLLLLLRGAGLHRSDHHTPRYVMRLGLGVLLVIGGIIVRRRRPPLAKDETKSGLLSRMIATPAPKSAFLVGLLVFAPGATFLAALQVIATARADLELTVIAVLIVVTINVLLVWVPIVLYFAIPEATSRYLAAFNQWLREHGRTIAADVLLAGGVILIVDGIHGLVAG